MWRPHPCMAGLFVFDFPKHNRSLIYWVGVLETRQEREAWPSRFTITESAARSLSPDPAARRIYTHGGLPADKRDEKQRPSHNPSKLSSLSDDHEIDLRFRSAFRIDVRHRARRGSPVVAQGRAGVGGRNGG